MSRVIRSSPKSKNSNCHAIQAMQIVISCDLFYDRGRYRFERLKSCSHRLRRGAILRSGSMLRHPQRPPQSRQSGASHGNQNHSRRGERPRIIPAICNCIISRFAFLSCLFKLFARSTLLSTRGVLIERAGVQSPRTGRKLFERLQVDRS